jgi:hypothetical protein
MHNHTRRTRPFGRARAIPGKHAKVAPRPDHAGKAVRRIAVTALLSSLAVGSAAGASYAASTGHATTHHPVAIGPTTTNDRWMY